MYLRKFSNSSLLFKDDVLIIILDSMFMNFEKMKKAIVQHSMDQYYLQNNEHSLQHTAQHTTHYYRNVKLVYR